MLPSLRGSGALAGYVDIILEMRAFNPEDANDRRRILHGYSRHEETPKQVVLQWKSDGTDYHMLGDVVTNDYFENWDLVMSVLADSGYKMSRREIRANWPPDHPAPGETALWAWLDRGVAEGQLQREGNGLKGMPFRYWLTGSEKMLTPDLPPLPPLGDILGLR